MSQGNGKREPAYFASLVCGDSADEREAIELGILKEGDPFYQLQKNDESGVLETDDAAVEAALSDAERGDQFAIEQLALAATDPLVFRIRQQRMTANIQSMADQAIQGSGLSHDVYTQSFSRMVDSAYPPGSHNRDQAVTIARSIGDYATPEELAQAQNEMAEMGYCTHGLNPDCCPCGCGEL